MSRFEPTDLIQEIGTKLFPRRYRRFPDLRPYPEACEWARTLDWRQNPYDRFLLRRELLHHLESTEVYHGSLNIFAFASRREIATEVERLMDEFSDKFKSMGVFGYVLHLAPWHLAFKHGMTKYSKLNVALAKLPEKTQAQQGGRTLPSALL
jgi:hypothetical protein